MCLSHSHPQNEIQSYFQSPYQKRPFSAILSTTREQNDDISELLLRSVLRGNDIWDGLGLDCLKFLCKTISTSYPLYVTPTLEPLRIPGKGHCRITCQELEKPSHYFGGRIAPRCVLKALELKNKFGMGLCNSRVSNVLSPGGVGELRDFECEKKNATCSPTNFKTGTSLFLASEIIRNAYHFVTLDVHSCSREQLSAVANMPFRYNPLHDLESAWWTFFWIVLSSNFVKRDLNIPFKYQFARERLGYAKTSTMDFIPMDRSEKMSNPAVVMLHALRMRLLSLYQEIESNTRVDEWDFSECHHEMIRVFDDVNVEECSAQVTNVKLKIEDDAQTEKRRAGEDDGG